MINKVAIISIRQKKVLVSLSKGKDTWYIPGGKVEAGESNMEALIREVREELGVGVVETSVAYYGAFRAQAHGKAKEVIVEMRCYRAELTGEPSASSEIAKVKYAGYEVYKQIGPVDKLIFDDLKRKKLII